MPLALYYSQTSIMYKNVYITYEDIFKLCILLIFFSFFQMLVCSLLDVEITQLYLPQDRKILYVSSFILKDTELKKKS